MATRPAFGALKKAKPAPDASAPTPAPPAAEAKKPPERIQTSIRLSPEMWAALSGLATRKRVETGLRVTVHDLMIEGAQHILAVNGIKLSE